MTAFAVSVDREMTEEAYLRSNFESDVDFVDDHTEERYVGEIEHSNWQRALMHWFMTDRGFKPLIAMTEVRVKVAARRYRVPDVAVFAEPPRGTVVLEPPLAIFEILSPEDRYSRLKERFRDYEKMGVRNLFAIESRTEYTQFREGRFQPISIGRSSLEGSNGFVDWAQVTSLLF